MSRTKKRITTPLIHEKGSYVHRVRTLETTDAEEEIALGMEDYESFKERVADAEWDEYWRALDADLEYQQAWAQYIDEEQQSE